MLKNFDTGPSTAHPDHHIVIPTILDERDRRRVDRLAVERRRPDRVLDAIGVLDRDPVAARPAAVGEFEAGPGRGIFGSIARRSPLRWNPRIASRPTRNSQEADPVYQVQPPRPVWGGRP